MSDQVFGTAVTDSTVMEVLAVPNITARDRAEWALVYMASEQKADLAREFVDGLKRFYGSGTSTLCSIYNATGGTIIYANSNTWGGNIFLSPYPHVIQNGQWGTFLHISRPGRISKEAVAYRGVNSDGRVNEWIIGWNTTSGNNNPNRVHTEVRQSSNMSWVAFNNQLERNSSSHAHSMNGCYSSVSVGAGDSPYFTAVMTLEGLSRDATTLASDISKIFPSLDSKHIDDDDDDEDEGIDGVDEPDHDDDDDEAHN